MILVHISFNGYANFLSCAWLISLASLKQMHHLYLIVTFLLNAFCFHLKSGWKKALRVDESNKYAWSMDMCLLNDDWVTHDRVYITFYEFYCSIVNSRRDYHENHTDNFKFTCVAFLAFSVRSFFQLFFLIYFLVLQIINKQNFSHVFRFRNYFQ